MSDILNLIQKDQCNCENFFKAEGEIDDSITEMFIKIENLNQNLTLTMDVST